MNLTKEKLKKIGKQAAKTVAGLLAAASLALGGIVDAPEELFTGAPAAQVVRCDTGADDCLTTAATSASDHKERLRDKLRRLFLSQPSIVRGIVLLPFWAIGKALLALCSLLFTALSPVLQIILSVLLNALLLFGLFLIVLKLLFPNLRLRDLSTKRNIILLSIGSILLSVTDAILRTYWEDYRPISIAVKLAVGLIVITLLCWRIFGNRIKRELNIAT